MKPESQQQPASWEPTLRGHLATLCMAAMAGKPGDLSAATNIIVEFCRALSGSDK